MKRVAVLAAVLAALAFSASSHAAGPDVNCGSVGCDPGGGGFVFCNSVHNGFYAYDRYTGWWRCGYGYAPGPGPYVPAYGFVGSCPAGGPYWGWCWFWRAL